MLNDDFAKKATNSARHQNIISLYKIKSLLPPKLKAALGNMLPYAYALYERSYILNTLGLKKFYDKKTDSLCLGQAVFPLEIACDSKVLGVFNSEFPDIVYPLLPDADGIKKIPFEEGPYELGNVKISSGDIVFDCGANMGLFSIMTGNFNCKCYAFEPMPANIERLEKIIQVNPHVILAPYAVCDKDGTVQFANSEKDSTSNKISSSDNDDNLIDVDCTSLDSFVEKK